MEGNANKVGLAGPVDVFGFFIDVNDLPTGRKSISIPAGSLPNIGNTDSGFRECDSARREEP
jgi:hypothetical protein